jgi:membrane fusion protein, multidrug efflux system
MTRRILVVALVTAIAAAAVWVVVRGIPGGAVAQAPSQGARPVAVEVATAVKKKSPVQLSALGNVSPIASVAVRPRIDSEITAIEFADGAMVRQGDVLVRLDSRAIDAQIQQAEGNLARDQAQLEGAERDMRRYTDLVAKGATPILNLDNAKTQVGTFAGAIKADQAQIQNLKVQLSYCTIKAPISGRISVAALKVGNFVRVADSQPIATIIQIAPIYVTFTVPQASLPDIRKALAAETATVIAITPGESRSASGAVTMIENTVDGMTGLVTIRATMPNTDDLLWPGTLVNVQLTLRDEEAVVVPTAAVQVSQQGTFVFVVRDGKAAVQPVKVARVAGRETVLESGLQGGETVVTDGFLQLTNGARVAVRGNKPDA